MCSGMAIANDEAEAEITDGDDIAVHHAAVDQRHCGYEVAEVVWPGFEFVLRRCVEQAMFHKKQRTFYAPEA